MLLVSSYATDITERLQDLRVSLKANEELIGKFGWEPHQVEQCIKAGTCYTFLAEARGARYRQACLDKRAAAAALTKTHNESIQFLEAIDIGPSTSF